MKVIQFLMSSGEGGLEKHVIELCNSLAIEHEVVLISSANFKERLSEKVELIPINVNAGRRSLLVYFRLFRIIRCVQPDIIHCHANKAASILSKLKPCFSIPVIATVHGYKKNTGMYFNLDGVIAVSERVSTTISNANKKVIYNGVDIDPVEPTAGGESQFHFNNNYPTIAAVGRLAPVKAFNMLITSMQGVDANLIICGDGEEKESLSALVNKLGLSERVLLAGHRNDIIDILNSVDAIAISSEREGFPYVLTEALLTRLPIISTDVSDVSLILHPDCVVNSHNSTQFSKKLSNLIQNIEEWRRLMQPAFEFANDNLTKAQMIAKHNRFYREIKEKYYA